MMNFLRRQATSSGRKSLFRFVAASLTASGVLYSCGSSDTNSSLSLALPVKTFLPTLNPIIPNYSLVNPFVAQDKSASSPSDPCHGCLGRYSIADAASRIIPAVVNISSSQELYGVKASESIGSGILIDPDGTIITCAHIVASKGQVNVTLQDGRKFKGNVLNFDSMSDIAVVKINSKVPLPAASLGSSSKLRPGDWVVAVGSPFTLQNTVTAGIVSCVDRKASDLGFTDAGMEYLQTDCSLNSGSSGGPLVNIDGEIVGINAFKALRADGLAFAVPIDSAMKILEQFKKRGEVIRPWLGMKLIDLNKVIIEQLREKDDNFPDVTKGVLVPMITPGSPAQRGGIQLGDVIVEFDGISVESTKEIVGIMGERVGVPLKVVVKRSNATATLFVTPQEAYSHI